MTRRRGDLIQGGGGAHRRTESFLTGPNSILWVLVGIKTLLSVFTRFIRELFIGSWKPRGELPTSTFSKPSAATTSSHIRRCRRRSCNRARTRHAKFVRVWGHLCLMMFSLSALKVMLSLGPVRVFRTHGSPRLFYTVPSQRTACPKLGGTHTFRCQHRICRH